MTDMLPKVITSKTGMPAGEAAFHWLMIFCTFGFWWPVYKLRKRAADRTTTTYLS
jgi:hypothetical protein